MDYCHWLFLVSLYSILCFDGLWKTRHLLLLTTDEMQLPCWFSVNWWFHNYFKFFSSLWNFAASDDCGAALRLVGVKLQWQQYDNQYTGKIEQNRFKSPWLYLDNCIPSYVLLGYETQTPAVIDDRQDAIAMLIFCQFMQFIFFCFFLGGIPSLISRRFKIVKTFLLQINLQKHAFCKKNSF